MDSCINDKLSPRSKTCIAVSSVTKTNSCLPPPVEQVKGMSGCAINLPRFRDFSACAHMHCKYFAIHNKGRQKGPENEVNLMRVQTTPPFRRTLTYPTIDINPLEPIQGTNR